MNKIFFHHITDEAFNDAILGEADMSDETHYGDIIVAADIKNENDDIHMMVEIIEYD